MPIGYAKTYLALVRPALNAARLNDPDWLLDLAQMCCLSALCKPPCSLPYRAAASVAGNAAYPPKKTWGEVAANLPHHDS